MHTKFKDPILIVSRYIVRKPKCDDAQVDVQTENTIFKQCVPTWGDIIMQDMYFKLYLSKYKDEHFVFNISIYDCHKLINLINLSYFVCKNELHKPELVIVNSPFSRHGSCDGCIHCWHMTFHRVQKLVP